MTPNKVFFMKKKKNGKEILENQKLEETTITQTHKVIAKGRYIFNMADLREMGFLSDLHIFRTAMKSNFHIDYAV